MNPEKTEKESKRNELFLKSSDQFRNALRRVIAATSSSSPNGRPTSRKALSKEAGIATSTLSAFLIGDREAKENPPNPTLEAICKTAEALNVPPALLLMTTDDWIKFASAFELIQLLNKESSEFLSFATKYLAQEHYQASGAAVAEHALKVASLCGYDALSLEKRKHIVEMTSQTLPLQSVKATQRPILLVVAAVFALSMREASESSWED